MGMTLFSLHVLGGAREDMAALARPDETVRVNGAWVSLLPGKSARDYGQARLTALVKKVQQPAVLFGYVDDDWFYAALYVQGKRTARVDSSGKSTRASAFAQVMEGDAGPLRFLPYCATLDEQLALLEEALGVALYDAWDMMPRLVARGTDTLHRVQARWNELRRRPNQFRLEEVAHEAGPAKVLASEAMAQAMDGVVSSWVHVESRGRWHVHHRMLMDGTAAVMVFDAASGKLTRIHSRHGVARVLTVTGDGMPVCLQWNQPQGGPDRVACLNPDGSERWCFVPVLGEYQSLDTCEAAPGLALVYNRISPRQDTSIWVLNADSGEVIHHRIMAAADGMVSLLWVEELQRYAVNALGTNEMVMLDEALREVKRWPLGENKVRFDMMTHLRGSMLWNYHGQNGNIIGLNLATGHMTRITLEIPAILADVTVQGQLLCFGSGANHQLLCFDMTGKLTARLRETNIQEIICGEDGTYLVRFNPAAEKITVCRLAPA